MALGNDLGNPLACRAGPSAGLKILRRSHFDREVAASGYSNVFRIPVVSAVHISVGRNAPCVVKVPHLFAFSFITSFCLVSFPLGARYIPSISFAM